MRSAPVACWNDAPRFARGCGGSSQLEVGGHASCHRDCASGSEPWWLLLDVLGTCSNRRRRPSRSGSNLHPPGLTPRPRSVRAARPPAPSFGSRPRRAVHGRFRAAEISAGQRAGERHQESRGFHHAPPPSPPTRTRCSRELQPAVAAQACEEAAPAEEAEAEPQPPPAPRMPHPLRPRGMLHLRGGGLAVSRSEQRKG